MTELRNIAIIAHVDHGKTTMVDELLKQSGAFRDNQQVAERAMDSNDLERERGITILAKCTSVEWQGVRINIVDTPGHADFGGEVERILSMVDGVLLLVDAAEGPMPQTKFVTTKALQIGLKPVLVINKVDKPDARPYEVQDEVFDLFSILDASDEQLDFPTIFASAKNGWAAEEPDGEQKDMSALFDVILKHVQPPEEEDSGSFSMIATMLEADPYLGRILTGRIHSGKAKVNTPLKAINQNGEVVETGRITKLLAFRELERVAVDEAGAGDLVAIAGLSKATVADTLGDTDLETAAAGAALAAERAMQGIQEPVVIPDTIRPLRSGPMRDLARKAQLNFNLDPIELLPLLREKNLVEKQGKRWYPPHNLRRLDEDS